MAKKIGKRAIKKAPKKKYKIIIKEGPFGTDISIDHKNGNKILYSNEDYSKFGTAKRILNNLIAAIKSGDFEIVEDR